MSRLGINREHQLVARIGWLRAAVLGANDGIVSTASLIIGVAAAAAKVLTEAIDSLLCLALLGSIGARAGDAPILIATVRVTFWGAFAMVLTAGIGLIVGTAV